MRWLMGWPMPVATLGEGRELLFDHREHLFGAGGCP
jgi:hypothetical protein